MNRSNICLLSVLLLFTACEKEQIYSAKTGKLAVEFVDFDQSCDWNLRLLNGLEVYNFQQTASSSYLYSDIDLYNENNVFQFGDTLQIEFEVLEHCLYPKRPILCIELHGVPVRLLSIKKQ